MDVSKIDLNNIISYREHAIASKSFSHKLEIDLPFAVYAMDKEETISNEQSSLTRLFQVIDGILTVNIGADEIDVTVGEILVVPANTLHKLVANQKCQFIQFETN